MANAGSIQQDPMFSFKIPLRVIVGLAMILILVGVIFIWGLGIINVSSNQTNTFLAAIFIVLFIAFVLVMSSVVKMARANLKMMNNSNYPKEVLKRRYEIGRITKEEYDQQMKNLEK